MAYCGVDEVLKELHPTLKKQMEGHYNRINASDPSEPDFTQFLEYHVSQAESHVNASLARAYKVPLRTATGMVISAVAKVAAYFAAAAFSEKEEILKDKYETANLMLDNLVEADDITLVDEDGDKAEHAGWGSDPRIFTVEELKKW